MPPQLAFLVCTAFILFLLRLERKQFPEASYSLWIPTIYVLIISSKPLALWFGTGGPDMESGSSVDRVVLSLILCLGLVILVKRQFDWIHAIHGNPWVALLIAYMLISILWSDIPFSSFKRWIRELVALTMAFMLLSEKNPLYALQSLITRTIYILIPFSLLLVKYYPHLGVEYARWSGTLMWIGVGTQKNSLCRLCLFAIFFLVWNLMRRRQRRDVPPVWYQTYIEIFLLLLTAWLFMGPNHTLAYSATSTIALSVGLIALVGFLRMKKLRRFLSAFRLILIMLCIIIYGTITPFVGKLSIIDVSSAFGRDETLTDRSAIWATLVPYALEKPVLGYGFGGFWTDEMRSQTDAHAHNGYLDIILNIGFLGLILLSLFLLSSSKKAYNVLLHDFDSGALLICLLLMAIVHNIAESTITSFGNQLVAFILFSTVCITALGAEPHPSSPGS